MSLAHRLGRQLQCPRGRAGSWLGHAMTLANDRAIRTTVARLDVRPTDNVLELGFGPGRAIARLASLAPEGRVCGVDLSSVMLRQARRHNAAAILSGRVELRQGRFEALPFPDAGFDRIIGINVVYFWDRESAIMKEIIRVSRPAVRIAVYATHRRSMEKWSFARTGSHRMFDEEALRQLFLDAGFAAENVEVTKFHAGFGVTGLCAVAEKFA